MSKLKRLALILPPPLRFIVRDMWRKARGNPEFHILRLLADRDRAAIDVGANSGDYTILLGSIAKSCIAFEPNPPLASVARQRAAASGLENVQVEACALSDRDTELTFRVPILNGVEAAALATVEASNQLDGAEVRSYTVPCRRLDSFAFDPVGVMKIDAEGHEGAILAGAKAVISRDRPSVMIEVEERHKQGSVALVRHFFERQGYRGYFLLGRKLVPIESFSPSAHQNMRDITAEKVRFDAVYVNNFIFTADEEKISQLSRLAHAGHSL